jgi:hypothetical protein
VSTPKKIYIAGDERPRRNPKIARKKNHLPDLNQDDPTTLQQKRRSFSNTG